MRAAPVPTERLPAVSGLRSLAAVAVVALALGGCTTDSVETTGSIGETGATSAASAARRDLDGLSEAYKANPGDPRTAFRYARALRATDQVNQASAVLQQAAIRNPRDTQILAAYGKSLVEAGRPREALEVLANAHTPANPDWRVLSAEGSASAQLGDQAAAQGFYEAALKIRPNEPSLLSNLGLSYALSRHLDQAEETMRLAVSLPGADAKMRANLALVLGLKGRYEEAETVLRQDMGPQEAASNVASLRRLAASPNRFKDGLSRAQRG